MDRNKILQAFHETTRSKKLIIGAGAGIGLCAKCEDASGIDFITLSSSDYFLAQGRWEICEYLPLSDGNELLLNLAPEILTVVKKTPVFAGIYANDTYRFIPKLLEEIRELGFLGVTNAISMGGMSGYAKKIHDSVKIIYEKEVEMIIEARKVGLVTAPYCFTAEQAREMVKAGADMIIARIQTDFESQMNPPIHNHLDAVCKRFQEICDAAMKINRKVIVLCHADAISQPSDLEFLIKNTKGCAGYHGTVTIEGDPVRSAIRNQIASFKSITF